jgi:similar to spore coat protein
MSDQVHNDASPVIRFRIEIHLTTGCRDVEQTAQGNKRIIVKNDGIGGTGMNTIIEHMMGMNTMTDQVIASDFLITAKSGIRNYSMAITETASPEIKAVLHKHLQEAIDTHEQITGYMMERGFYHPYNVNEQIQLDMQNIQTALNIPL